MEKYFIKSVTIIAALILTGCGAASIKESEVSSEPEKIIEYKYETVTVEKEVLVPTSYVTEIIDASKISYDTHSDYDTAYSKIPGNATRELVYIGHPRDFYEYCKLSMKEYTAASTDTEVAIVDNCNQVIGLKEGKCDIIFTSKDDPDKQKVINIVVTTFNDNKKADYKTEYTTSGVAALMEDDFFALNGNYAKELINTVEDMTYAIDKKGIRYADGSPVSMDAYESCWNWAQDGNIPFVSGIAVCCDITNAALYALRYDYEDAGTIFVAAKSGHIFNYFYEDGRYIVVDFTKNLTEVRDRKSVVCHFSEFKTIEELKASIINEYVMEDTYGIYMFPAMGKEYHPATYLAYCRDNTYNPDNIWVGVESIVKDNAIELYNNGIFELRAMEYSEIPMEVPLYGDRDARFSDNYMGIMYSGNYH